MSDLREEIAKKLPEIEDRAIETANKIKGTFEADVYYETFAAGIASLPSGMVITKDGISRDLTYGELEEVLEMLLEGKARWFPVEHTENSLQYFTYCIESPDHSRIELKP